MISIFSFLCFIFSCIFHNIYTLSTTKHSSWWRSLSSSSSEDVFKTSPRHLDQDEYIRLSHTSSEDDWRRLQDVLFKTNIFILAIRLQYVLPIRLQDVFKTFSGRLQDVFFKTFSSRRFLQDVFKASRRLNKTSSRRLQSVKKSCKNVFKTSSRPFQDLQVLQEFFKAYHQVKLFLLASLREVLQKRFSTDGFA